MWLCSLTDILLCPHLIKLPCEFQQNELGCVDNNKIIWNEWTLGGQNAWEDRFVYKQHTQGTVSDHTFQHVEDCQSSHFLCMKWLLLAWQVINELLKNEDHRTMIRSSSQPIFLANLWSTDQPSYYRVPSPILLSQSTDHQVNPEIRKSTNWTWIHLQQNMSILSWPSDALSIMQ